MVVDVLKVQPGENLTEVLYTPATPEQVTSIDYVLGFNVLKSACSLVSDSSQKHTKFG